MKQNTIYDIILQICCIYNYTDCKLGLSDLNLYNALGTYDLLEGLDRCRSYPIDLISNSTSSRQNVTKDYSE